MRVLPSLAILLAILLVAGPSHAERIHNDRFNFSVTIPDGFERVPELESSLPRVLYAYKKADPTGFGELILIQNMGGTIGREHLKAGRKLHGTVDPVLTMRWRAFDVDAAEVPEKITGGTETLTYNVQVPLKPEAIQLSIAGGREHRDELVGLTQTVLDSLDGQSNWLRSLVPVTPGGESRYRAWMSLAAIAFICVGLVGIWLVARRNPGAAVVITLMGYAASWFIATDDVRELYLAQGALRFTSVLGFLVALFAMYRHKRLKQSERSVAQEHTALDEVPPKWGP